jgi:hypothetical protein
MHPCRDKNQHNTSMRNFQYYIVVIWPYMESCQIHECKNQWSTSIIIEKTNQKKVTYDVFRIPCLNEIFYKNRQGILLIIGCFDPLKQVGLFRLGGPNDYSSNLSNFYIVMACCSRTSYTISFFGSISTMQFIQW